MQVRIASLESFWEFLPLLAIVLVFMKGAHVVLMSWIKGFSKGKKKRL